MIVRLRRTLLPLMVRVAPAAMVVVPVPPIVPPDQPHALPEPLFGAPESLGLPAEKSQSTASEEVFNVRVPLETIIVPVMPRVTGAATVVVPPETEKVPAPVTLPAEMLKVPPLKSRVLPDGTEIVPALEPPTLNRSVPVLTLTVPAVMLKTLLKGMPMMRVPVPVFRVKVPDALLLKRLVPPPEARELLSGALKEELFSKSPLLKVN